MSTAETEPNQHIAEKFAMGTILIVGITAAVMGFAGGVAVAWLAGIAAALVCLGVLGGFRSAAGAGVISLAIASIVLTYDVSITETLIGNAAVAVICVATLVGIDLSFSARRGANVSGVVLSGFARTHVMAAAIGVGAAVVALAVALNVAWPGWLLLLPAVLLAAGAVVLSIVAFNYQKAAQKPAQNARSGSSSARGHNWTMR